MVIKKYKKKVNNSPHKKKHQHKFVTVQVNLIRVHCSNLAMLSSIASSSSHMMRQIRQCQLEWMQPSINHLTDIDLCWTKRRLKCGRSTWIDWLNFIPFHWNFWMSTGRFNKVELLDIRDQEWERIISAEEYE